MFKTLSAISLMILGLSMYLIAGCQSPHRINTLTSTDTKEYHLDPAEEYYSGNTRHYDSEMEDYYRMRGEYMEHLGQTEAESTSSVHAASNDQMP